MKREDYRMKDQLFFQSQLQDQFGDYYLVPEGGSNALGVKGCVEIVQDIQIDYQYLCCACGTGGTLAGLIVGTSDEQKKILGFSALKGGDFLVEEVKTLLTSYRQVFGGEKINYPEPSWHIQLDYHFGGYAKITPELIVFIQWFEKQHHIKLEQVYTGKMLFGLYDLMKAGYFKKGDIIIAIHTGGLQGRLPALNRL
jgi:1-aminocyclopropane-1-carboxylate deaminase/D-cysteine desulfhydrase-like pyridoxal-dependent ACC family enzyme